MSTENLQLKPIKDLTVWVNSAASHAEYELFAEMGIQRAEFSNSADIMVFVGGADVNPALYGEECLPQTCFNNSTDDRDLSGWRTAKHMFKVGICRGGQFLNVMNGGKLWQHVDGHTGGHFLSDEFTGESHFVSSTHHQMFRPAAGAIIIATARESEHKKSEHQSWVLKNNGSVTDDFFKKDFEVLYYPGTRSLCFQPHPEYHEPKGTAPYFQDVFKRCYIGAYEDLVLSKKKGK